VAPRPRLLTARELNRAVLARQLLLERVALPIPRALERMGGFRRSTRRRCTSACGRGFRGAGLRPAELEPAFAGPTLRRFRSEDGDELLDLPRAPLPPADTPAPVRFLPTWDATLLVHCRRARILPEEHRPRIFNTKMPQSVPTFLVDGAVAGAWRHDGAKIDLEPFGRLDRTTTRALRDEAARLAAFHAGV
jgi:Winged helix DNA-binding domain